MATCSRGHVAEISFVGSVIPQIIQGKRVNLIFNGSEFHGTG